MFKNNVTQKYIKWKYSKEGNPLKKILNKYNTLQWDWNIVSKNPNIEIEDFKEYKNLNYVEFLKWNQNVTFNQVKEFIKDSTNIRDNDFILFNLSLYIDMETVRKNLNFPWNMCGLAKNSAISLDIIEKLPEISYHYLVYNNSINEKLKDIPDYGLVDNANWSTVENVKKSKLKWTTYLKSSKHAKELLKEFYEKSTNEQIRGLWLASTNRHMSPETIFKYKELMDNGIFCENPNIDINTIKNNLNIKWDGFHLSSNINLTLEFIKTKPLSFWCIKKLFSNPCLTVEMFDYCEANIRDDICTWCVMGSIWTERLYLDNVCMNRFLYDKDVFLKSIRKDIEKRRECLKNINIFKPLFLLFKNYISYA